MNMSEAIRRIFKRPVFLLYGAMVAVILVFTAILQYSAPLIVSLEEQGSGHELLHGTVTQIIGTAADGVDQMFKVRANSGAEKGRLIDVSLNSLNAFNSYEVGAEVQIYKSVDQESGTSNYEIADYNHQNGLLWLVLVFALLSILIARKKGFTAILSIIIALFFFYFLFLRMVIAGYSPLLSCLLFVLVVTLLTIPMIHGFNKKSLSAILAILAGYLLSVLIAMLFAGLVKLGQAPDEDFRVLSINYPLIDLSSLLIASLFIGAVGALIDTAISISSAIFEALKEHSGYAFKTVYKIGMEIGKDVLASMTNTLLFAYLASSLPFLILITLSKGSTMTELINYDFIALELTRTFIGAISLVLLIPLTASISAYYFIKFKKEI